MGKDNKSDYAEHLVNAKLSMVKLSDAMSQRRFHDAFEIAIRVQDSMNEVLNWIQKEIK